MKSIAFDNSRDTFEFITRSAEF